MPSPRALLTLVPACPERPTGDSETDTAAPSTGNWDAPRLVGTLNGAISGPVNAVFCDKRVENIFPE